MTLGKRGSHQETAREMSKNFTTTVNGTQQLSCLNPIAERIGKTIAYCLLFVVSLAGNTFIGIVVYKTKTMRKPINLLIASMAMSDLLYAIFLFPLMTKRLYLVNDSWLISGPLGQALCKLIHFLLDLSSAVSIQSLVLIAVDRFGTVVFPLRSPLISSKLCPFFILVTWIVAAALNTPHLFVWKLVDDQGQLACEWQWNEVFGQSSSVSSYYLSIFIVVYFIPLCLIIILYLKILFKLKSHKIPGEQSVNAGEQRAKRERTVLKMSIAIVLAFAVCWLPLQIFWFLTIFSSDSTMKSSCGFQYFRSIAFPLAYLFCATNPCICFISSRSYRQGLKNLFSCFSASPSAANQV